MAAGSGFGYRYRPNTALIAHSRGRRNSNAPRHQIPIRRQASSGIPARPVCFAHSERLEPLKYQWAVRDSNPRPPARHAGALAN